MSPNYGALCRLAHLGDVAEPLFSRAFIGHVDSDDLYANGGAFGTLFILKAMGE